MLKLVLNYNFYYLYFVLFIIRTLLLRDAVIITFKCRGFIKQC